MKTIVRIGTKLLVLSIVVALVMGATWVGQAAIVSAQAPTTCANLAYEILGDTEEPAANSLGYVDIKVDPEYKCVTVSVNNATVESASPRRSNAVLGVVKVDDSTYIIWADKNRSMGGIVSVMLRRVSETPGEFGLTGAAMITGPLLGQPTSCSSSTSYEVNRTNESQWTPVWSLRPGVYSLGDNPWGAVWTLKLSGIELVDMPSTDVQGNAITIHGSCVGMRLLNGPEMTAWTPEGVRLQTVTDWASDTGFVYLEGNALPDYILVSVKAYDVTMPKGIVMP